MSRVTEAEALQAFRTLGRLLQDVYNVDKASLLTELELSVPAGVFSAGLSPFQALATHLHNAGIPEQDVARLLKRNRRFVHTSTKDHELPTTGTQLPVEIFQGSLSVLESAAHYLRSKGHSNKAIAEELGKSASAVWTLLKRADEKLGGEGHA